MESRMHLVDSCLGLSVTKNAVVAQLRLLLQLCEVFAQVGGYEYATREEATAKCQTLNYLGLCAKDEVEGQSLWHFVKTNQMRHLSLLSQGACFPIKADIHCIHCNTL